MAAKDSAAKDSAAEGNGKATNGSGPATNGKAYPIEDHTYDVVVVGAAGADDHDVVGVVFDRIGFSVGGGTTAVGGLAVTFSGRIFSSRIFSGHGLNSR